MLDKQKKCPGHTQDNRLLTKSKLKYTLERRDLFSTVLKGLNLLVDTKAVRGDGLAILNGYRDLRIKVRRHDGHSTLHILAYMLDELRIEYHVIHSHHYHTFKMRVSKERIDHFSCASSIMLGYLELLSNFDDRFRFKFKVSALLTGWVTLIKQQDYQLYAKLVKYMCAFPMTRMIHNDPPPVVQGYKGSPWIFRGRLAQYIKQRVICQSSKNYKFVFSILQLKRCALKMPDAFIFDALKKHQELMLTPCPKIKLDYLDRFKERLGELLDKMDVANFKHTGHVQQFSNSASMERSRAIGGASATLWNLYHGRPMDKQGLFSMLPADVNLQMMSYTPLQGVKQFHSSWDFESKNTFHFLEKDDVKPSVILFRDPDRRCKARVAAVEEPLKIRTVTCGESLPYNLTIGLQKDLHSSLKRFPQFALIGERLDVKHLQWMFDKDPMLSKKYSTTQSFLNDHKDCQFVSGDYTSATDTLNINLSKLVIEGIIKRGKLFHSWPEDYCNLVRSSIFEHELSYPRDAGIPDTIQRNGQLMGSILSFPLLCIINLIHYWITVKEDLSFDDLPVLVNGDDILFYTDRESYKNWSDTLDQPGFQMSLGKNYYSSNIFTINTRIFRPTLQQECGPSPWLYFCTFVEEEYFPVGKLLGHSKVESPYHPKFKPIWALQPDVIKGAFDPVRAWERFNFYHQGCLKKISKHGKYNYYTSPYFGGLGLTLPEGVKIFTNQTEFDKYKGPKTFMTKGQQRFSSFMFHYKREWYYDPFKSCRFGVRNDQDKFNLPWFLPLSTMSPLSESFVPDTWSRLRLPYEPIHYDEHLHNVGSPKGTNVYHSKGKFYDDECYTFYDTDIPKHKFCYVNDLVDPQLLVYGKYEKVYRINRRTITEIIDSFEKTHSPSDIRDYLNTIVFDEEHMVDKRFKDLDIFLKRLPKEQLFEIALDYY